MKKVQIPLCMLLVCGPHYHVYHCQTTSQYCMCQQHAGVLAGGTSAGYVVMWKWNGGKGRQSPPGQSLEGPDKWEFLTTSVLAGTAMQIKVCM